MKVAIVGIQGVPARYGGFESLVENIIGDNCAQGVEYTIFCSSKDMPVRLESYKGCRLKYIGLHANGISSIPYDILSMMQVIRGYDTILVLGTSGCIFLPVLKFLSKSNLVVNIDGLEHRREKWGRLARWFLRFSEKCAVKFADVVISDNKGIQDYVTETYDRPSELIAYGGDHVKRDVTDARQREILTGYGLLDDDMSSNKDVEELWVKEYGITVCRIEPENNCHVTLEAFAKSGRRLVFIGNWHHSAYAENLFVQYSGVENLQLQNAIYDLDVLYTLRSHAAWYVHGHSAGGTNPSLVEAMFFGRPILAYDVVYNRETTFGSAAYFSGVEDLIGLLTGFRGPGAVAANYSLEESGTELKRLAEVNYTWRRIAELYERLY